MAHCLQLLFVTPNAAFAGPAHVRNMRFDAEDYK